MIAWLSSRLLNNPTENDSPPGLGNLDYLPQKNIFVQLDYDDIVEICRELRNRKIRDNICNNENFWEYWLSQHWPAFVEDEDVRNRDRILYNRQLGQGTVERVAYGNPDKNAHTKPHYISAWITFRDKARYFANTLQYQNKYIRLLEHDPRLRNITIQGDDMKRNAALYLRPITLEDVAKRTSLLYITFNNVDLGKELSMIVTSLPLLEKLDLFECTFDINGTKAIGQSEILKEVRIYTKTTKADMPAQDFGFVVAEAISNSKSITGLELCGYYIGDEGATALANNSSFRHLALLDNDITSKGTNDLAGNKNLLSLSLQGNRIDDEGAEYLANNSTLKRLDLSYNHIGDEGVKFLTQNRNLELLDISHNSKITEKGAQYLLDNDTLVIFYIDRRRGRFSYEMFRKLHEDKRCRPFNVDLTNSKIPLIVVNNSTSNAEDSEDSTSTAEDIEELVAAGDTAYAMQGTQQQQRQQSRAPSGTSSSVISVSSSPKMKTIKGGISNKNKALLAIAGGLGVGGAALASSYGIKKGMPNKKPPTNTPKKSGRPKTKKIK